MAWNPFKKAENERPRTYRQLTPDEQEEIEQAIRDGATVQEVAKDYGVTPSSLYPLRRSTNAVVSRVSPEIQSIQAQMAELKAKAELERLEEELEYQRERRKLDLEIKRLELDERRAELEDDDEDDEELIEAAANNPEMALMQIIAKALSDPNRAPEPINVQAVPTAPVQIDWTKDATQEAIRAEMLRTVSPTEIAQVKGYPDEIIAAGLKKKYVGITENNIKLILHEIRHYGQQQ